MSIGLKCIADKLTGSLANAATLSVDEASQVTAGINNLASNPTDSVACIACLPPADQNTGRLIWVSGSCEFRYSNGFAWTKCFSTTQQPLTRCLYVWGSTTQNLAISGYSSSNISSPALFTIAGKNWSTISLRGQCAAAGIKTDGTLWTWGATNNGRLGNNSSGNSSLKLRSPVTTAGGGTNWSRVSTHNYSTIAIKTDGTLWTWGLNQNGQLGDGTTTNRSSPVTTAGGGTTWCQGTAGDTTTVAIKTNGTLWTWGANNCGQLGDGTTNSRSSPGTVTGGVTSWCDVSVYTTHTVAVDIFNDLYTWGNNSSGQLGDFTTTPRSSPVFVMSSITAVASSDATFSIGTAKTNGVLWAWGSNLYGKLGDGTTINRSQPVAVIAPNTDFTKVSGSFLNTTAIRTDGTLWTWGYNANGELGDGTTTNRSSPVTVAGGGTTWLCVETGFGAMMAICASSAQSGF